MSHAYQPQRDEPHHAIDVPAQQYPAQYQAPQQYQQPQQGVVAYGIPISSPQQQIYQPVINNGQLLPPGVILRMPSKIGVVWKVAMAILILVIIGNICLWSGLLASNSLDGDTAGPFFVFYGVFMVCMVLIIIMKTPTALDVTHTGLLLHTKFSTHSLPFDRMLSIEIVRSTWCWSGAACSFPKGGFTTTTDCIFMRSIGCGSSIAFSPQDLNQLIAGIRQTQGGHFVYGV